MSGVPLNTRIYTCDTHLMGFILDILPKQIRNPSGIERMIVNRNMHRETPVPDKREPIRPEKASQL